MCEVCVRYVGGAFRLKLECVVTQVGSLMHQSASAHWAHNVDSTLEKTLIQRHDVDQCLSSVIA